MIPVLLLAALPAMVIAGVDFAYHMGRMRAMDEFKRQAATKLPKNVTRDVTSLDLPVDKVKIQDYVTPMANGSVSPQPIDEYVPRVASSGRES